MASNLPTAAIDINRTDRSIVNTSSYGTFSEDLDQLLLPDQDPTTSSVVLPLEFIDFNETVKRYYITPYLLCIENQQRVLNEQDEHLTSRERMQLESQQRVASEVTSIVENVVQYLCEEGEPLFQGGELSRCGSVEEGTKVGKCDEFDYQYLITADNLQAIRKPPLRTKPRSSSDASKSFFRLLVEERVGDELFERELLAKDVHDRFKEEVDRALLQQILPHRYILKKSGPAVKIVLYEYDRENRARCEVKIDLTLGIKADPRRVYKDGELTPLARNLPWGLTFKCHFVCAHDYWKIAFVETEQELMKRVFEHDEYKMACYRAIKCIRDMADVRDPYGDGILPSYPIKMTFLNIALKDYIFHVIWKMEDVASYTIRVLREVEERGQGHRLTSPFLLGEDVMAEADRSYLESRRILKKLKEAEEVFLRQQSVLQPFLVFISLALHLCYSWIINYEPVPPDIGMVPGVIFYVVLPIQFSTCIIGLLVKDSPRSIQPFYKVYNNVVTAEIVYSLVSVSAFTAFFVLILTSQGGIKLFPLMTQGLLLVIHLPAIVAAISIFLNAIYSLILGKNLQLYNSMLLFPQFAWKWRTRSGKRIQYLPELCDGQGLNGFAKVRAVIVMVLAPIAIILSIGTTILVSQTNAMTCGTKKDLNSLTWIVWWTSSALILIIVLLLFQQFLSSTSWRKYFKSIWKMRFRSIISSSICYPLFCCCPKCVEAV